MLFILINQAIQASINLTSIFFKRPYKLKVPSQILAAPPPSRQAEDRGVSEDDLSALGRDPQLGGAQHRGPRRQEPRARRLGPRQARPPGPHRGREAQPGIRYKLVTQKLTHCNI